MMTARQSYSGDLTPADLKKIKSLGMDIQEIERQLHLFKSPRNFQNLSSPCTPGNGIVKLTSSSIENYQKIFRKSKFQYTLEKFVPASGAASRMFKKWLTLLSAFEEANPKTTPVKELKDQADKIFHTLPQYAFFGQFQDVLNKKKIHLESLKTHGDYAQVLKLLLKEEGLGLSEIPKGLIPFHIYHSGSRTAFTEHLEEAILYANNKDNLCKLHFTISPQYSAQIKTHISKTIKELNKRGVDFDISYSVQNPITDTLAATQKGEPFRDQKGNLIFRPGGHGALIHNLSQLKSDLIFVKNIDNVCHDRHKRDTYLYKEVLGGFLISLLQKIHPYLTQLENWIAKKKSPSHSEFQPITDFCLKNFQFQIPRGESTTSALKILYDFLHRPVRVCGMVKNDSDTGGGPFWVENSQGQRTIQIVESAEVNTTLPSQKKILESATHFNPVDIVCSIKNHKGKVFDLQKYINQDSVFITEKSLGGKPLLALERPGLWNGSMAYWNTILVEVPATTFNPVKEVSDLLTSAHL